MVQDVSMLAVVSDTWIVSFGIFQVLFSGAVSLAIFRLGAAQRRYEGLEDRLHTITAKLVDERFLAMTKEVDGHVQRFVSTLDYMGERVKESERNLDGLFDRDQRIELSLAGKIDQLKDYMRETSTATLERFSDRVGKVEQAVAVLSAGKGARA